MSKKAITTSIVLLCVIFFTCLSVPLIAVCGESFLVRLEIHNPYVNSGFRGWDRVQIDQFGTFLIPDGWSMKEASGIYWILTDSGEPWAYGGGLGSEKACFDNYKDLITSAIQIPCREITIEPFIGFLMMNGSAVNLLRINGDVPDSEVYCVHMFVNTQEEIVWMLMPDLSSDEAQYDIAEAMVYSFAFSVRGHN